MTTSSSRPGSSPTTLCDTNGSLTASTCKVTCTGLAQPAAQPRTVAPAHPDAGDGQREAVVRDEVVARVARVVDERPDERGRARPDRRLHDVVTQQGVRQDLGRAGERVARIEDARR